ncbi:MAG: chondroitinase-B domain-containing protein [Candidatus Latescibacter sp.]|nr:chondroitinase-B domain-containing protein [Candidatus Latescibacter sp.]
MKKLFRIFLPFLLITCIVIGCAGSFLHNSNTIEVSTAQQFRAAVLRALPGSIIEAADGDYRFDDSALKIQAKGTAEAPIIIRAKHLGKARFTGEYAFFMEGCSYVTVEGFSFFNRALKHSVPGVLDSDTDLGANRDEAPLWGSAQHLSSSRAAARPVSAGWGTFSGIRRGRSKSGGICRKCRCG